MISLNNEPCCICGETNSRLVQEAAYPEHGYPGAFCLRRCNKCNLLFNSPRLDDRELGDLYGRNYYFFNRPDIAELNRIPPMYARTVALVADQISPKRVLDVGSGRGYFPVILKRLGWDAHGVEISSDAANYARKRFKLDTIFTGTIEQFAETQPPPQFPLVTAIDVIEHVPAPRAFVAALSRVVAPDGMLIIDTPNASAYNIRHEGKSWKGFNPFHIYLFNIANLCALLESNGFVVEQSFSYNNTPTDEHPPSIEQRAKTVALTAARAVGIAGPLAKVYFKAQTMKRPPVDIEPNVSQTAARVQAAPRYSETPDAREPLSRDATGDNIVVIARKK